MATTYTPQQLALIDEHRDWNVDGGSDWWQPTFEDFVDVAKAFGIAIDFDDIQFSGFWSQGDGASFKFGTTNAYDVIMAAIEVRKSGAYGDSGYVAEFYALARQLEQVFSPWVLVCKEGREAAEAYRFWAERTSHHYSHAGTVTVEAEWEESLLGVDDGEDPPSFFQELSKRIYMEGDRPGYYVVSLRHDIDQQVECIANALYASLREEHDYLTSDDAVWESLEANGITVEEEEVEEEEVDEVES